MIRALDVARIIFFYILIGSVVLFSPLGPLPSYFLIIVLSLIFMLVSGIEIRPGNPVVGTTAATLAMIALFMIIYAAGGFYIDGLRPDFANALLWGAVLQLFVATGEELSFRNYLFADLDKTAGRKAAAVISSLGFAVMHLPSLYFLNAGPVEAGIALITIFTASIVMTVLFIKAGILAAIGFHFAWNFLQYHVFGFSHMDAALEITKTGFTLLNGGIFGPEASVPGLIVVAATLAAVWYYYSRKERKTAGPEK
ncbi:lysostaphin resistance A-like protein [Methanocella sp. MCL-LM]|uniref:CPBP family intramembrane glutamic endopeptidase n=1 Tax=Methanocella sp. MCL-LM TaxID=3412035 RepID=UPI003C709145